MKKRTWATRERDCFAAISTDEIMEVKEIEQGSTRLEEPELPEIWVIYYVDDHPVEFHGTIAEAAWRFVEIASIIQAEGFRSCEIVNSIYHIRAARIGG